MVIGIISIILAMFAALPSFVPGAMSYFGVCFSLIVLLISCFSTNSEQLKYLTTVLVIVTINIFVLSEFSFALSKKMYSHSETAYIKIVRAITYNKEAKIREEKSLHEFEAYLGYKLETIDYKAKEKGYWQFVRTVIVIISLPYLISIYCVYSIIRQRKHLTSASS